MNKNTKIFALTFAAFAVVIVFLCSKTQGQVNIEFAKTYFECGFFPSKNAQACYAERFEKIAKLQGASRALAVLIKIQKYDKKMASCHDVAHLIGKYAFKESPSQSVLDILKNNISDCEFGVTHGMIEAFLDSYSFSSNQKSIADICGSDHVVDCNHIVGHFLLVWTNKDIDKALLLCRELSGGRQVYICDTGVFMEYITAQNLISHNLVSADWFIHEASLENLTQLCDSYKNNEMTSCWEELAHAIVPKFNYDLDKSNVYCELAKSADAVSRCKSLTLGLITGKNPGNDLMFSTNN